MGKIGKKNHYLVGHAVLGVGVGRKLFERDVRKSAKVPTGYQAARYPVNPPLLPVRSPTGTKRRREID
jgi:hypothetical protein